MFFPLPMRHISLLVIKEQAAELALTMARLGVFEPRTAEDAPPELPEAPAETYRERAYHAQARLEKVLGHLGLPGTTTPSVTSAPDSDTVAAIDSELSEIWRECSEREERLHRNREETRRLQQLAASLETYAALNIDLDLLHQPHRFLDLRVGTLPPLNHQRLNDALGLAGYRLSVFQHSEEYLSALLVGPRERADEIRQALESAGWHTQSVPAELRGHPQQARKELELRLQELEKARQGIEQERQQEATRLQARLQQIMQVLASARPYADLADALRGHGGLALVTGWVPLRDVEKVRQALQETVRDASLLRIRPPHPEERQQVPSCFNHPRWLSPFLGLVNNYGVPRYGEFDPTLLFAITYIGMFGMMFGDIGHGLCIVALAPLLRKRMPAAVPFMILCGLSATLFGWAYGSIFGYEHVITPLWISPLTDPVYMLEVATITGVCFILLSTLLAIRNQFAEGNWREASLQGGGLAGLVLYLSLIWLALQIGSDGPRWAPTLLLLLSLAAIMAYSAWENREAAPAERILIVLIEAFESVMKFVSGTLSYLRLAAFSLNHVALAIAVFTLAAMMDTAGYWITVVLGNLFILVLEGAIVMIQALRLEYYEGFSRFFRGDGRAFRPLRPGLGKSTP